MKTIWNAITVIALANLLAVGGFIGWLKSSDRLDMDRVRHLKAVIAKTVTQEKAEEQAAQSKAAEDERAAEAARAAAKPPLTATERLAARVEATELDNQRAERLRREVLDMQRQLSEERERLQAGRDQLAADRKAFDEVVAASSAASSDGQFQKTLAVLEGLKPQQAIALLKEMMPETSAAPDPAQAPSGPVVGGTGAVAAPPGKNLTQAVGYLDAMDDKHRGAIMKELAKSEPKLAAQLLERIRKQGEFARVP